MDFNNKIGIKMTILFKISGEFRETAQEKEFLDFFFAESRSLLSKNLIIAMFVTLIFIFTDFVAFKDGKIFFIAAIFRIFLALLCGSFILIMKKITSPLKMQNLLFMFTFFYIATSSLLFHLVPYASYSFIITGVLIVLALHVFLPQRFNLALTSSALTSLFFLLPIIISNPENIQLISEGATYLFAANVFGIVTLREINKYKRLNFLMLKSEQNQKNKLQIEIHHRKNLEEQLREQVSRDYLTGLYNRRYFYEIIEVELSRSRREGKPVSVILFDLDFFKSINDKYGHKAGDETLKSVARVIEKSLRIEDILARVGGEEFAILVPGMKLAGAGILAERLRQEIEGINLSFNEKISASFGVVELGSKQNPDSVMNLVDLAMYNAKRSGRNKVYEMA